MAIFSLDPLGIIIIGRPFDYAHLIWFFFKNCLYLLEMKNYTKFYELIAILKRSNRVSSIPRQPPPSEGGSARKRLRYRGKGAQNLKNLCRKTKKKEKTVHKQKRGAQNFAYLADIWFRVVQVRSQDFLPDGGKLGIF